MQRQQNPTKVKKLENKFAVQQERQSAGFVPIIMLNTNIFYFNVSPLMFNIALKLMKCPKCKRFPPLGTLNIHNKCQGNLDICLCDESVAQVEILA